MNSRDKGVIVVLLKIARICGTFPFERPSHFAYYYQIFIVTLNLLWSIFSIYNNTTSNFYENKTSMFVFTDLFNSFFIMVHGLSIQLIALWCPSAWRNLYKDLKIGCCKTTTETSIYLEILAVHLYSFVRFIFVNWTYIPIIGIGISKNYIFRNLNEYYSFISIMMVVHVNNIIRRKFRLLNEILRSSNCVRHVQMNYRKTTHLIDSFNGVFGYQILFIMAHAIVGMLECLNNVLTLHDYTKSKDVKVTLWSTIYSFCLMVFGKKCKEFCSFGNL